MNILHTSDLHLGETWEGIDRKADEQRVLGEILELCDQHRVEILLVTGDVFSDRTRGSLASVARRFFEQLAPAMRRGMRVVLLRGNHDDLRFFQLLRYVCQEWLGAQSAPPIIADLPDIYTVPGTDLQVIALPYIAPSMLESVAGDISVGADERVVGLTGLLAQQLQSLYQRVQPDKRTIFAGHIMVRGAQVTPEYEFESGYHREMWITPDDLPHFTGYNALGHIHLSQKLNAAKPSWYAGAPDRRDLGERGYCPQVLLVELPNRPGGASTVTPLLLTRCTPFVEQMLHSVEEVRAFCDAVRATDPLGRVTLDVAFADRVECETRLREAASRVRISFTPRSDVTMQAVDGIDPRDVFGTVREYIQRNYADAAVREQLLAGFARLWEEVEP